jgi:hypothetical protein
MKISPSRYAPSYLVRNPYSYCFRIAVPVDLQSAIGKKELRYSLHTGYLREAKTKASAIATRIKGIFVMLRKGEGNLTDLTDEKIKQLAQRSAG